MQARPTNARAIADAAKAAVIRFRLCFVSLSACQTGRSISRPAKPADMERPTGNDRQELYIRPSWARHVLFSFLLRPCRHLNPICASAKWTCIPLWPLRRTIVASICK